MESPCLVGQGLSSIHALFMKMGPICGIANPLEDITDAPHRMDQLLVGVPINLLAKIVT